MRGVDLPLCTAVTMRQTKLWMGQMYPPHQSVSSSGWATTTAARGRRYAPDSSIWVGVIVFVGRMSWKYQHAVGH